MALVKCKHCGHQVSKSAKSCPGCGAPKPSGGIGLGGLLLILVVGYVFYYMASGPDTASRAHGGSSSRATVQPEKPSWHRSQFTDDMTGAITKVAILRSVNTTHFDFPYKKRGGSALNLVVRKAAGKYDAYFQVDKGQILCSASRCTLRVKIGDQEPSMWEGNTSATYNSDVIFVKNESALLEALSKGQIIKVGIDFYKEGERVFDFDPSGYQPL